MAYECCIGDNALPSKVPGIPSERRQSTHSCSDTQLVCARSNRHSPAYHSPGPPSRQRRVVLERQFPGGLAARRDSPSLKVLPQTDLERLTRASEKRRCGTDTLRLRSHVHTHTETDTHTHADFHKRVSRALASPTPDPSGGTRSLYTSMSTMDNGRRGHAYRASVDVSNLHSYRSPLSQLSVISHPDASSRVY